jgi:protein-tyrosine phosphatase
MKEDRPYGILMVCTGNICRSPTAQAVLQAKLHAAGLAPRVRVDSAGTHGYHCGSPPDERSQAHAARRGYDLSGLRARQITAADFERHDLVLAMDRGHLQWLRARCPSALHERLQPLTRWCRRHAAHEVPDPYYGGAEDFEYVLDLVEDACEGLTWHLQTTLGVAAQPALR